MLQNIYSFGSDLDFLQCRRLGKKLPCEGRRPEHAFLKYKSRTNLHILPCTRMKQLLCQCRKPDYAFIKHNALHFALYRTGEKSPVRGPRLKHAGIMQEQKDSSHGRVEAQVPLRPAGPSMIQNKLFSSSCNERDWKAETHARAKARAPSRTEGPSLSLPELN